ncbi:MAG: hypothetical protein IKE91_08045 [Clostridia bacterium]|nr:hypothetical protein [Clostridia bacterium]
MKLIEFKEFSRENFVQAINKRKVAITIGVSIISLIILTFILLYVFNPGFRKWADTHILMKVVHEGSLSSIDIDEGENISVYAYDKYIAIINGNKMEIYNSSAKSVASHEVNVITPIFDANGKYMVIGDKGKQKVYLVSGTRILWNTDIEGSVSRVSVNENGYVSVVCTGSTYKSVVCVYDTDGSQLFKTYIPSNTIIDSTISSDNKLLSIAEVDTSKTSIQSIIKTISIKDATTTSNGAFTNTYSIPENALVINIKYQGNKNLLCMCDNGIYYLYDGNMNQLMNFNEENKQYSFAGINLSNTIFEIEESSDGIKNQKSIVHLKNSASGKNREYTIDGIAKETASSDDNIAINLGTEVYFINSKGWLIKQYIANQEVKNVIVSDRLAAIIFKDKIEILIL